MKFVSFFRLLGGFALALLLSSCAGTGRSRSALPRLMVQRLDWMDEVALAKTVKKLPIHDPKREAELLAAMTQRGTAAGLQAENVRGFFSGQMEAAKVVQEEWLRQHPHGLTSYVMVPDLTQTIRPALDEIGKKMIEQLALAARKQNLPGSMRIVSAAQKRLKRAGYSEAVIAPAIQGLRAGLNIQSPEAVQPLKPEAVSPPKSGYPFHFPSLAGKKEAQPH